MLTACYLNPVTCYTNLWNQVDVERKKTDMLIVDKNILYATQLCPLSPYSPLATTTGN